MSSCLAVETFFRSPAREAPGAWRAPRWDMDGGPEMIGMRTRKTHVRRKTAALKGAAKA